MSAYGICGTLASGGSTRKFGAHLGGGSGDDEKLPNLRAYLKAWASETKRFFGVANADVPDEELTRIAPNHPIFRIQ